MRPLKILINAVNIRLYYDPDVILMCIEQTIVLTIGQTNLQPP